MYSCGIDIGSVSSEAVIIDQPGNGSKILAYEILPTGGDSKQTAENIFQKVIDKAGLSRNQVDSIIATGYGRINIPFADKNITEISCHARGVINYYPETRTVVDVGGQDSKVIKLDIDGNPVDFLMNDKCAAGTGRFLEVMAKALEIDLENFADIFMKTRSKVEISSTCTVFAESEIVSLIGHGVDKNSIVKGLTYSITDRLVSMIERIGLEEPVCMTGGVAKNMAVVRALEEKLEISISVPEEPQITGALGAALLA